MLIVCPTIDYEIFLGKNLLSADEILFKPTEKILKLWKDFNINGTFFPDVCSVWQHKKFGINNYVETFESQMKKAVLEGHDIQLHLHPEWLSSEFLNKTWHFKEKTSSLNDLGFNINLPDSTPSLVLRAKQYLEDLISPTTKHYKCFIFRAGGWLIQPSKKIIQSLLENNINIDSSVIPGFLSPRIDYKIDFRSFPNKTSWFVNTKTDITDESKDNNEFLEITIGSYQGRYKISKHIINQLRLKYRANIFPESKRGYPITKSNIINENYIKRIIKKYKKLKNPRVFDISDTCESMISITKSYLQKYDCETQDLVITMNGHSKDLYNYHIIELEKYFDIMKNKYSQKVKFLSLAEYIKMTFPHLIK